MEGAVSTGWELFSGVAQKLSAENTRTEPRMYMLYLTVGSEKLNNLFRERTECEECESDYLKARQSTADSPRWRSSGARVVYAAVVY